MKVAILYSGGKDSTYAIDYAKEKGWEIEYLLSVKPTRTDCFLFHFATVENTKTQAEMLGVKHILTSCDVADPVDEAKIVADIVKDNLVDAVILGGTGLQKTQIKSIQDALRPLGVEAFASHEGEDQEEVLRQLLDKGYEVMITQIASDGLQPWLGKVLTKDNFSEIQRDARKYGFWVAGDGGYYDTYCLESPLFSSKIEVETKLVKEDEYCGHIEFTSVKLVKKVLVE